MNEAVKLAVDRCIRNDILSNFFVQINRNCDLSIRIRQGRGRTQTQAEYEAGVAAGFNNGIDTAKRMLLLLLQELHVRFEQIASALQVDVKIVRQWIGNK